MPITLYSLSILLVFGMSCGRDDTLIIPNDTPDFNTPLPDRIPGSYIVAFKGTANLALGRHLSFRQEATLHYDITLFPKATDPRVRRIHFITGANLSNPERLNEEDFPPKKVLSLGFGPGDRTNDQFASIARVDFQDDAAAHEVLAEWEDYGTLWYHEPNYLSDLSQTPTFTGYKALYEKIAQSGNLWWHEKMELIPAFDAIAKKYGSSLDTVFSQTPPIVAVMDSGVDIEHPGLKNAIWTNDNPGVSACGQDIHGCNTTLNAPGKLGEPSIYPYGTTGFNQPCTAPSDKGRDDFEKNCRHGTHVSGIVAADPASGAGGGCPICKIMVIRVVENIEGKGRVPDSAILNGLKYVSLFERGGRSVVKVLNSSFGKFQRSRTVNLLVRILTNLKNGGVLVVGAAGNEDTMKRTYPAAFDDAVAVSSVNNDGAKSDFSNFGPWVDIAAPGGFGPCNPNVGGQVYSTLPGGAFGCLSGTSMAAPMVSGIAGLLSALNPTMSAQDLRKRLLDSSDDSIYNNELNLSFYKRGVSDADAKIPLLGAGQVNARRALEKPESGAFLPKALNRVKPGCAGIGSPHSRMSFTHWYFFSLPLILFLRRRQ